MQKAIESNFAQQNTIHIMYCTSDERSQVATLLSLTAFVKGLQYRNTKIGLYVIIIFGSSISLA